MEIFLTFIFASYAAWYITAVSDVPVWSQLRDFIGEKFPRFIHFLMCPFCWGFWCSLGIAWFFPVLTGAVGLVVQALCACTAIYVLDTYMERLKSD